MNIVPTTRLVVLLAIGGFLPLLFASVSPVFPRIAIGVDVVLLTLWLAEGLWLGRRAPVEVKRTVGERLPLLREAEVQLTVTNLGTLPIYIRLRDAPPEQFLVAEEEQGGVVGGQRTRTFSYEVTPTRRGLHRFDDLGIWVEGGLRLAARRHRVALPQDVAIYPDLHMVKEFDVLMRRNSLEQMGIRRVRRLGSGREFDRLREYQPDDEYRHINWKATARRARPISNVFQVERGQDIILAVDCSRMMGLKAAGRTKLDACVEAALFLARAAIHNEDNVGLVTFSSGVDTFLPPRRGKSQVGRIVRVLYDAADQPTVVSFRRTFQFLASRVRKRALVVCFTDLLDEDHARDMLRYLPLVRRHHLPLFVTVSDQGVVELSRRVPENERETYETVVAQEMIGERQNLVRALERQGAHMVDVPAHELSLATVNTYLRLKSAQLL